MAKVVKKHVVPMTAPLEAEADVAVYRFYWLKRLSIVLILFVGTLIGSWFVWSRHEQGRLEREERQWREAGLDLFPAAKPAVADSDNGAVLVVRAAEAFEIDPSYDAMVLQQSLRLDDQLLVQFPPGTDEAIDRQIAINAKSFDLLHRALAAKHCVWPVEGEDFYRKLDLMFGAIGLHAHTEAMRHHERAMLADVVDLVRVRRLLKTDRQIFLRYGIAYTPDRWVMDLLSDQAQKVPLHDPAAREMAATIIKQFYGEAGALDEMIEPLTGQAAAVVQRVREPRETRDRFDGVRWVIWRLSEPARKAELVEVLEHSRSDLAVVKTNPSNISAMLWNGLPSRMAPYGIEPAERLQAELWPNVWSANLYVMGQLEIEVQRRCCAVSLACRMYAADHDGALPVKLDELVPKYLPKVPGDPLGPTGSVLSYKVTGPGKAQLNSTGMIGLQINGGK